jgi:hypothetical protein
MSGYSSFQGRYATISEGDYQSAGFTAPFPALASLALHAVKRGISEEDFGKMGWRAGRAVHRRSQSRVRGEIIARKVYRQAEAFSKTSTRGGSTRGLQHWVEQSAMWLHRFNQVSWRGRGSASERKVLTALTERALKAHSLTVNASLRLLQVETLLPRTTVAGALERLEVKGFLTLEGVVGGARVVNLNVAGVAVFEALDTIYGSTSGVGVEPVTCSGVNSAWSHEVFARKGLNGHHGFVWGVLRAGGVMRVADVAAGGHVSVGVARRVLKALQIVGFVRRVDRFTWMVSGDETRFDLAAKTYALPGVPTAGLRERVRLLVEVERFHYREWLWSRKLVQPSHGFLSPVEADDLHAELLFRARTFQSARISIAA